ncbi:IS1182 family transposase [uncultured Duncaniella sp.]|uniref:IS1182 family transposase n=1 Tax=uncultured Duncaniella sp. TaxID=2768039 RepID=UPI0026F3FAB1|nr:IS1182 family transposase [uncultured Duncaniella sp.]
MAKLAIKSDNRKQNLLLPPSLDELVPENHMVRVVDAVIDRLDISDILSTYRGGGNSAFNPKMMLKVLVFAYLSNVYSSRRIEELLKRDIYFMWLAGMKRPDFRTINYYRGKRLKEGFDAVFTQVVRLLHEEGFVSLKVQYIDGTKIESVANKYTFVWRGSVEKYDARLKAKTEALLRQIEQNHAIESQENPAAEELTAEDVAERIERIKEKVDADKLYKEERKALKQIETDAVPRMNRYKEQLETMGSRNSYSKTDPDATFMRMKEDAMLNGQLKPGYNVQISTENQFITNFGIYQRPTDTLTMIGYLESFKTRYGMQSEEIVADSGYGSEENYEYMFSNGMTPYVKYNMFHVEQRRGYRNNPFRVSNLFYNPDDDFYVCPMGQKMKFVRQEKRYTASGYQQTVSVYRASRCEGCPLRGRCHKSKHNRQIEVNHTLDDYKARARELLTSEQGLKHRSNRPIEPEAVFGQIKECGRFRRLRLKGLTGAKIDFGLKALAHNLRKLAQAWAKSSFFDKFLSSETAKQLYTNTHLNFYPKLISAVANAA